MCWILSPALQICFSWQSIYVPIPLIPFRTNSTSFWRFFSSSFFVKKKQPSRIPTPYCPQHPEVWFLRVLDKFSFGSFYWNYSRMPPIITLLLGRAPTVSSSSLIPMKWPGDGEKENPNLTWIMINSAEHWGKLIDK